MTQHYSNIKDLLKKEVMFNKLFTFCTSIGHFNEVVTYISYLLDKFDEDYSKDSISRDAAIDAIIEILQAHKTNKG